MEETSQLNLSDIDAIVQDFLERYDRGLSTLHRVSNPYATNLSFDAFISELIGKLRSGCVTFVNNNNSTEGVDSYLFYISNTFAKQLAAQSYKKTIEYLCPGCLFLCKTNLIIPTGNIFKCDECSRAYLSTTDHKKQSFFKSFKHHNKNGYKCPNCNRFIPKPIYGGSDTISCPYLDCYFVGNITDLKKMNHPSSQTNPERFFGDTDLVIKVDNSLLSIDSHTQLKRNEELDNNVRLLKDIIDNQSNNVPYNGTDFTLIHKVLVYQAFKNMLEIYPEEIVEYLLHKRRTGGFQNKIFQEYIRLLEDSFPFCFKKRGKIYRVDSLLDPNLHIFDGISVFDAVVNDKLDIKNNTQEFYIGGRKASYSQPFYIGKLLNVIDKTTKEPLLANVKSYGFSKIKMQDILPGTEVTVTHLRVPPHYQMGGMVYINRIRKKIVDSALDLLGKRYE